jgi:hypothetical protein
MHWRGKAAVLEAHEVIHRKIFHSTEMTITDVAIKAATSDVAVAVVMLKMADFIEPDGELRAETQDKLSLILVKCEDRRHRHNRSRQPSQYFEVERQCKLAHLDSAAERYRDR